MLDELEQKIEARGLLKEYDSGIINPVEKRSLIRIGMWKSFEKKKW